MSNSAKPSRQEKTTPNIVFLLVDNVGWGDFGAYGGTTPTPRIDKLASEGIRFNNYNVEAQCTPSRSAIMTGRMPVRSGTFAVTFDVPYGLAPWEYTIANLLSDTGYATALYGKWHLGEVPGRFPTDKGFDEWWGIPNTWDEAGWTSYPQFKESGLKAPMILEGKKGQPVTPAMPLDLSVRGIVDEKYIIPKTVNFIKHNAAIKKPFFVYVGYSELHPPLVVNPNFERKSEARAGSYADLIGEMDYRIGQILDALKEADVEDNTVVVLSSDNATVPSLPVGSFAGGSNGPWHGDFSTPPYEGSYRTLAMIRWPGHVPSGVVTEEMLAATDWLPTLAAMVGASNLVPKDRPIDGIDASKFLLGRGNTTGRDTYMFFGPDGELMSIKWKMFKIIFRYSEGFDKPIVKPQFPIMFDLSSDPHERWNLFETRGDNTFTIPVAFRAIMQYEMSVKKYPNIKPGEEFKGYPDPTSRAA